jgi:hypothetical protein
MSDLGKRIDGLSPEKRALLEQRLLQQRAAAVSTADAIPRRLAGDPAPLSFSQQRLWFLDQLEPGAPTYNAALPMLVRGPLDVAALRSALETVTARHEAVRTVFAVEGGEPAQVVLDDWSFELPVIDVSHLSPDGRQAEASRLLREESRRPFDLSSDLMLRATIVRLGPDEHILLFQEHHIAFDGWSDRIMFDELAEIYAAQQARRTPQLPELPIQYRDFALWQQRRMQGEFLEEHLSYWRRQLSGAPALLELPTDFPRPQVQTYEGAHHYLSLPSGLALGVRELSRQESTTPFMTLLAAFAGLLYRLTGEDDILVGSPIANRGRAELEGLIGFFSNTLVLRTRVSGNPTFRQLLRRAREVALGAYAHQDLPFEKVVEAVGPVRNPGANPLFQVNFRVQTGVTTPLELPGLSITPMQLDVGFSRFDLAVELQLLDDGLRGYLEYNTALFRQETATKLGRVLGDFLGDVVASPDTPLLALQSLDDTALRPAQSRRRQSIKSFRTRPTPVHEA